MKKRNERERAEERHFVEQFCDVIENGDPLEERDNPDDMGFMPSSCAKHKAPLYDIGIQEKPNSKKKTGVTKGGKKLPNRSGRGFNPKFASDDEDEPPVPAAKAKTKGKSKVPVDPQPSSDDEVFLQLSAPKTKTKMRSKVPVDCQPISNDEVSPPVAVP